MSTATGLFIIVQSAAHVNSCTFLVSPNHYSSVHHKHRCVCPVVTLDCECSVLSGVCVVKEDKDKPICSQQKITPLNFKVSSPPTPNSNSSMNINISVNVVLLLMAEHDDPLKTLVKHFTVMSHNTHTHHRERERGVVFHHTAAVPRPQGHYYQSHSASQLEERVFGYKVSRELSSEVLHGPPVEVTHSGGVATLQASLCLDVV